MEDSRLVRKMFRFDLTGYNFEDEIRIFCVPITEKSVVFLGIIPVKTSKDFKTVTRFLFSGIYPKIFLYSLIRLYMIVN